MIKVFFNFIFRILFCTFTFHKQGERIQSNKAFYVYSCDRCGNMFAVKKDKYKDKKFE